MLYCDRIDTFLMEMMLIKKVHQKSDICHYWVFSNYSFNKMSATDVVIYDVYKS